MSKKECIAMLLAGGQGSRLGALTSNVAKPAVSFGGKFRIIDFALSNCANSGVTTVGVLTQYRPYLLHNYIGTGGAWNLDDREGGVSILPPYATQTGGAWYEGTADAVTQNLGYIEQNDPEYVLILSGDHIYKMDYGKMLEFHKDSNADCTIAVLEVPWEEASRFGIMTADENNVITKFEEKPKEPKSHYAVTGLYFYDEHVVEYAKRVEPSARGELEITDLNRMYLDAGMLNVRTLGRGYAWLDTGTMDSLFEAGEFVRTVQRAQGLPIAIVEEIAFENGWITRDELMESADRYGKSPYGQHLKGIADGEIMLVPNQKN